MCRVAIGDANANSAAIWMELLVPVCGLGGQAAGRAGRAGFVQQKRWLWRRFALMSCSQEGSALTTAWLPVPSNSAFLFSSSPISFSLIIHFLIRLPLPAELGQFVTAAEDVWWVEVLVRVLRLTWKMSFEPKHQRRSSQTPGWPYLCLASEKYHLMGFKS